MKDNKPEIDPKSQLKDYDFGTFVKIKLDVQDVEFPIFACINVIDMCEQGCPAT